MVDISIIFRNFSIKKLSLGDAFKCLWVIVADLPLADSPAGACPGRVNGALSVHPCPRIEDGNDAQRLCERT